MKKHLLTKLLLIAPYLYILIVVLLTKQKILLPKEQQNYFIILGCFLVFVFIPNMIYAFVLLIRREAASVLLFWDMLLKLCNIPIYIVLFSFGSTMAIFPGGIVISFLIAVIDYILLLPSTIYGVCGLLQARRENKITTKAAVVNIVIHFFFCTDVFSAIVMYCKVKRKNKSLIRIMPIS